MRCLNGFWHGNCFTWRNILVSTWLYSCQFTQNKAWWLPWLSRLCRHRKDCTILHKLTHCNNIKVDDNFQYIIFSAPHLQVRNRSPFLLLWKIMQRIPQMPRHWRQRTPKLERRWVVSWITSQVWVFQMETQKPIMSPRFESRDKNSGESLGPTHHPAPLRQVFIVKHSLKHTLDNFSRMLAWPLFVERTINGSNGLHLIMMRQTQGGIFSKKLGLGSKILRHIVNCHSKIINIGASMLLSIE